MRARHALLSLLVLPFAPLASGCDLVLALVVSPFFPGQPLPPPEDLTCPLDIAAPAELPPLPTEIRPVPPQPLSQCDVSPKTLHRLNRAELDNSIRDLTGLDLKIAETAFPPDDFGNGFDNQADVLAMSPLLAEKLESAASEIIASALRRPGEVSEIRSFEAELGLGGVRDSEVGAMRLSRGGVMDIQAILPNAAGKYVVRMRVGATGADSEVELLVDGVVALRTAVTGSVEDKQLVEVRMELDQGPVHQLGARHVFKKDADGEIQVDFFEVEGPLEVTRLGPDPQSRQRIVQCDLEVEGVDCARDTIVSFARRAWRRPLTDDERSRYTGFLEQQLKEGDDLESALRTTLTAVLLSPSFLYRVEFDPDVSSPEPHPLSDHELAARLSYFIWSSMPDDRLMQLADMGALQDPEILAAETRRMLDDPRSKALSTNFAGQWLFTRAVDGAAPDPIRFPNFDESLRDAMQCETELTFDRYLRDDTLDVRDIVTDDFTFVNDRLAQHYGLEPPVDTLGHGWGMVSTAGTGRSGLLTQASLLTVTSQPTRTSPTRRGKWVLENLLCSAPPPPPPGVEGLPEPAAGEETESLRERLEQHRSDPVCASCHAVIDPIGLGMEHFDAVGRWRASDAGFRIDDSALYMDDPGRPLDGARDLGRYIHDDPLLSMCITQKTMTYALGRSVDDDFCNVADVMLKFERGGYHMKDLIVEVVLSPAFRMRRAEVVQ